MTLELTAKRKDFVLIFLARVLRMFSYGMLAVIMIKNLELKDFSGWQIGFIQSAVILGDIVISLILTTRADIIGRKNTLVLGAFLKVITGLIYASSSNIVVLVVVGVLGVISVTGTQIGPFLSIEQSVLTQIVEHCSTGKAHIPKNISKVFGYYNLFGYVSEAIGAAFAGLLFSGIQHNTHMSQLQTTNIFLYIYSGLGFMMFVCYCLINNSEGIEAENPKQKVIVNFAGIEHQNFPTIVLLSLLFAMDAFGGAFIAKSFISFYFYEKYEILLAQVGILLFFCNIISGISGILSSKLVDRIGALATMVFTHLPSNFFLIFIPFVTNSYVAMGLIMGRFCISQMDVPARQTYVTLMVSSSQRSAANGITNIARSLGLTFGMGLNGYFISSDPQSFDFGLPFLIASGIKISYDLILAGCFLWNKKKKENNEEQFYELQSSKSQAQVQVGGSTTFFEESSDKNPKEIEYVLKQPDEK